MNKEMADNSILSWNYNVVVWGNTTIWGKPLIVINKFNQFIKGFYFRIIFITINEIVSEFSTISNGIYVTL